MFSRLSLGLCSSLLHFTDPVDRGAESYAWQRGSEGRERKTACGGHTTAHAAAASPGAAAALEATSAQSPLLKLGTF